MSASFPLSSLVRDPVLAAFFRRGEEDTGGAFAVPTPKPPVLRGGDKRALAVEPSV